MNILDIQISKVFKKNWQICEFPNAYIFFLILFFLGLYCFYLFLQGIAIDERVLMMSRNHSEGVPNSVIDNINMLSKGVGDAALRLRRRFMRTRYVPRDVPESAINVSPKLNDSIRVSKFSRSDSDIT